MATGTVVRGAACAGALTPVLCVRDRHRHTGVSTCMSDSCVPLWVGSRSLSLRAFSSSSYLLSSSCLCFPFLSYSAFAPSGTQRYCSGVRQRKVVTRTRFAGREPYEGSWLPDLHRNDGGSESQSRGLRTGRGKRNVQVFVDHGEAVSTGSSGDTVEKTLEKTRRLLALQKELLEKIEKEGKLFDAGKLNAVGRPDLTAVASDEVEKAVLQKQSDVQEERNGAPPRTGQSPADNLTKQVPKRPLAALWQSPSSSPSQTPSSAGLSDPGKRTPAKPRIQPLLPQFPPSSKSSPPRAAPSVSPLVAPIPKSRTEVDPIIPSSSPVDLDAVEGGETEEIDVPPPLAGPNVMNVVLVAAECAPWSKTGGLGDVVGALPKALARRGHRVMAIAPRYTNYDEAWDTTVRKVYNVAGRDIEVGYFHAYVDKVDFVFVDSPIFHSFAGNIYGGSREDVLGRMILLCKAAVEAPWHVPCGGVPYGDGNLVFIANDWHTALLPVYLKAYYRDIGLMKFTRCVLVIHNMAHQGRGPMTDFAKFGLPDHYAEKFQLYDPIGGEHCNVFKAGLMTAHRIVTVSHGYAQEVQTQDGGWGLDGVMREYSWKLRGIVNGIDDQEWNPEVDPFLGEDGYANYSLDDLSVGKAACKAALQKELGLPIRSEVPLIGFIGRLDSQKGVDVISEAMPWMMSQDLQVVMLGTGRKDLEDMLRRFENQHSDKVRGWVGFSVKTSHRITAGVDILLMPSKFEPCGLNQLYAMRYGTVPIVRAVGGLRDTVKPFDPFGEAGTGWTFDRGEASALIQALGNAMWTYLDFKPSWEALQRRGMTQNLSWDNAAQLYEEVLVTAKYQW